MIVQNVSITSETQTLEFSGVPTDGLVLDRFVQGDAALMMGTQQHAPTQGTERTYYAKPIVNVQVMGWVYNGQTTSLVEHKIRLNRFVKPGEWVDMLIDGAESKRVLITESVKYGTTRGQNNDQFCWFAINGVEEQVE